MISGMMSYYSIEGTNYLTHRQLNAGIARTFKGADYTWTRSSWTGSRIIDYFQKSELSDIHKPLLIGGALRGAIGNVSVGIGKIEIVYDINSNLGMDFTFSSFGSRSCVT